MSAERLPFDEIFLKEKLRSDPTTWETRRQLAHGLYDKQAYEEAAEIIWTTDQIPSTDLDLAFAIRVLAKAQPRRAIRLLTAVLELNQGKPVQNMAMANALLHHGMVLQAARFYGAALEADPTLVNPDLEHFVLWSDDECTMWDLFDKNHPKLGELPWMLRDPKEALRLTSRISLHTTPIYVPELPKTPGENLKHDLYQQEAKHQAKITPPPAVTIPIDRVDPKDRLYDEAYGATVVKSAAAAAELAEPDAAHESFVPEAADEPVAPVAAVEVAAPIAPVAPPAPLALEVQPVPSIPRTIPSTVGISTRVQLSARPTPLTSLQTVESVEPVETFPAQVVFPDSSKPTASVAPAAPAHVEPVAPVAPAASVSSFPAQVVFPDSSKPTGSVAPVPFRAATLVTPDEPPVAPETPAPAALPFFADPTPPPADSVAKAVSFLGDERLTGSVKLPPAPATPFPQLLSQNTPEIVEEAAPEEVVSEKAAPEEAAPEPTKKAAIPEAFPISQSSMPTTLLHVKWSTSPARPSGGPVTPPVAAPIPVPPPVAPPIIPFAPPMPSGAPPLPVIPAATLMSAASPHQESPVPVATPLGIPTGPPTRPLIPIGPPATGGVPVPTGAPTRALLPSGTPPPNPTGAPTRVLLPSGTPPENAGAPRRLLLTPSRPVSPPENNEGQ